MPGFDNRRNSGRQAWRARGFDLKYHVIWCMKYRYKIAWAGGGAARDLIRQICQMGDVVIVRGAVPPDHIHLLLSAAADSISRSDIKDRLSRNLQVEFPELRNRYKGPRMWARGYFCTTAGKVNETANRRPISRARSGTKTIRDSKIRAPTEPQAGSQPINP